MKTSQTINAVAPAFVQALAKIGVVKKDSKNPFLKNKYASLDAIIEATKPILKEFELAAFQIVNDDGIETVIMHSSGEWISSDYIKIMPEVSKGLSAAQAVGVATTYAKRYQLGAMLNVSTEEDTDGQYADNKDLTAAPLPELKSGSKAWKDVVTALKNGYTMEQVRKKYTVSDKDEIELKTEAEI